MNVGRTPLKKRNLLGIWGAAAALALAAPLAAHAEADAPPAADGGGMTALPPLPPDLPPAVRAYLEALQKQVQQLQQQVRSQQPAPEGAPGTQPAAGRPAPAVLAPRGSRL